jgi:hypothetical protein
MVPSILVSFRCLSMVGFFQTGKAGSDPQGQTPNGITGVGVGFCAVDLLKRSKAHNRNPLPLI